MMKMLSKLPDYRHRLTDTFLKLASIESSPLQERKFANHLKNIMTDLGCSVKEDSSALKTGSNCGNLICKYPGGEGPVLLFSCHMDRKGPYNMGGPVVKGSFIRSRGADDISGITALIEALRLINTQKIDCPPLVIIFTTAEESGMRGAKFLSPAVFKKPEMGFVLDGEGPVGAVINHSPEKRKVNIIISAEKGRNVIKIASCALSNLNFRDDQGKKAANIFVSSGGTVRKKGPGMVELKGSVWSMKEKTIEKKIEHFKNEFFKYTNKFGGELEFAVERLYSGFHVLPESRIIKLLKKSYNISLATGSGGSDACVFNERGLPAVNLGTAVENIHTNREKVKIQALSNLMEFVLSIIVSAAGFENV